MDANNLGLGSRWPGVSVTSLVLLINFLVYCTCSSLVCARGFDSLLELPGSRSRRTRSGSKRVLSVGDFGARGDGLHNDTQAFEEAWRLACSSPGRTKIVIPAGYVFLLYPVDLSGRCRSKITLDISGTIVAPQDPRSWEGLNPRKWIYFHGVNHLTMEGEGSIDGRGQIWWAQSCKTNKTMPCRHAPTAVTFHKCKDLKVRNIRIINSQQMHIAITNCIRVTISRLIVIAPASSPNTDGIHVSSSRGVGIKYSTVRTGDDCISIVGNSSRIGIRNFSCGSGHGISIGSLGNSKYAELVHDVVVDGAFLSNTDNGVRIKTWQGGKGNATEIKFHNILMEKVSHPIIVDQYYCDSPHSCANQSSAVNIKNVSFAHIRGTTATREAIRFACSDKSPCEDIYLEDIQLASHSGEATSFCWQARGSSHGLVSPPPCISCGASFIQLKSASDLIQYS